MQLIFSGEPFPLTLEKALFLAGNTSLQEGTSWRTDAIQMLQDLGFNGVVYIPEENVPTLGTTSLKYEARIRWERDALKHSDVVIFWYSKDDLPLINIEMSIELGWLMESGNVILGMPPEKQGFRHLQYYAQQVHLSCYATLFEAVSDAVNRIGSGGRRQGGETAVPLSIWRTESFQEWLSAQKAAGNRLDDASVKWVGRVGLEGNFSFLWILYVKIWVVDESRHKENEWIIGRPNISSVLLYLPHPVDPMEIKVVLVREFRSPVSNSHAKIYELPGGSTFEPGINPHSLAIRELREETGFLLGKSRTLRRHIPHQLNATTLTHKCHLFSIELTLDEMASIESRAGNTFGNCEDTERTTLVVMRLRNLLGGDYTDYATLGMLMQALADNGVFA